MSIVPELSCLLGLTFRRDQVVLRVPYDESAEEGKKYKATNFRILENVGQIGPGRSAVSPAPYDKRTFSLSRRAAVRRGVHGFPVALFGPAHQRGTLLGSRPIWPHRSTGVLRPLGVYHCLGQRDQGAQSRRLRREPSRAALLGDNTGLYRD